MSFLLIVIVEILTANVVFLLLQQKSNKYAQFYIILTSFFSSLVTIVFSWIIKWLTKFNVFYSLIFSAIIFEGIAVIHDLINNGGIDLFSKVFTIQHILIFSVYGYVAKQINLQ